MEHSKTQTLNKADETSARTVHATDKLMQATDKLRQAADESVRAIHRFMDNVTTFENIINELSDPERDAKLLLEQLKQSVDGLTHVANQLTQTIDESASSKS
jgi:methyl-accepting chemotaxis protein